MKNPANFAGALLAAALILASVPAQASVGTVAAAALPEPVWVGTQFQDEAIPVVVRTADADDEDPPDDRRDLKKKKKKKQPGFQARFFGD